MAQREGIDLTAVAASGPEVSGRKRVLEEDLLNFLNQRGSQVASPGSTFTAPAAHVASTAIASTPAPAAASTSKPAELPQRTAFNQNETVERSPLRGLRRAIANSMVKSKFTAPHYCYVDDFECSELVEFRKVAKESAAQYGVKFSYLPLIVKAVVAGLKAFPQVNASLEETEKGFELVTKKFYHVGIAVNSDNGLLVPVIKHADQKSLLEIAHEINVLSEKTRAGKATADELKGSTFTITSMGNVGGRFATPIINYPEVGIMGVYKIRKEPVVQNDQIVVGQTMTLSLSLDHRVIDGVVGAEFSNYVIDRLKNPAKLMLEMY